MTNERNITKEFRKSLLKNPLVQNAWIFRRPGQNKKFKKNWKSMYNIVDPPLRPEIDLAFIQKNSQNLENEITVGVELKYFKYDNNDNIVEPYFIGFSQALSYYQFGFDHVAVWHVYDEKISGAVLFDLVYHTWNYFKQFLNLPIDFTPFQVFREGSKLRFKILQPSPLGDRSFVPMDDISAMKIRWDRENPMKSIHLIVDLIGRERNLNEINFANSITLRKFLENKL